jgi:hypothetical protein
MKWNKTCVTRWTAAFVMVVSAGTAGAACTWQPDFDDAGSAIQVLQPTFSWNGGERGAVINALGVLKNTSAACADNIVVEVRFFDEQKNVVDVITSPLEGIVVPASKEVAFRVQGPAAQPKSVYASMSARVVSAEQRYRGTAQAAPTWTSRILDVLASWGPMLLLIAVWIWIMRRYYSGKKSPQHRNLDLWAQQLELQRQHLAAMQRLADSVQKVAER